MKFLILLALVCTAWRMMSGRWPWQPKIARSGGAPFAEEQARVLLGVTPTADRAQIIDAHRRRIALVHPDRGGSSEQVHEANSARDLLLAGLSSEAQ